VRQSSNLNALIERLYTLATEQPPARFGGFLYVADPDVAMEILRRPDLFVKDYGLLTAFGRSRLSTNGAEWEARRDLTQPHYQAAARPANRAAVRAIYDDALDRHARDDAESVASALIVASTTVFLDALDARFDIARLAGGFDMLRDVVRVLETANLVGDEAARRRGAVEGGRVRAGIAALSAAEPRLSALMARFAAGGARIDGFVPSDEFLMNLFAGIETATTAIAWGLDRLGVHLETQEALREETATEGDWPLTDAFVNEVLRVFPPIPLVTRRAEADFACPGFEAKPGAQVLISIVGLHHNPRHWQRPRRFDPSREEFVAKTYSRRAFLPFLLGPRVCGGASLARLEIREGIAAVLARFRMKRDARPIRFDYALSLRPVFAAGSLALERW